MAMANIMEVPNLNAADKTVVQQLVVASNDYEVRIAALEWRLIRVMTALVIAVCASGVVLVGIQIFKAVK